MGIYHQDFSKFKGIPNISVNTRLLLSSNLYGIELGIPAPNPSFPAIFILLPEIV